MESSKKTVKHVFFGVFAAIILYSALMQIDKVLAIFDFIKKMLAPFIVGGVIAFILNVPMRLFENMLKFVKRDSLRRTLAIMITFVFVGLILAIVFMLLIPEVSKTIQEDLMPVLKEFFTVELPKFISNLLVKYPWIEDKLYSYLNGGLDLQSLIPQVWNFVSSSLGAVVTGISSVIGFVSSFLMDTFVAVVFTVYCLSQKEVLARQGRKLLYAYLKEKTADQIVRILRLTNSKFSNFLSGQCLEVVILGSMFAVSMAILKMDYIALISVLIAVTAFIPIVGAWIGCIVGAFLMLVTEPIQAVWFVILFLALQQIENHLIYPKVVGNSIGLSGMWVLIAVAVGGAVFGVAGMFLMIPMTSVIYTLMGEYTHKRLEKRNISPEKLQAQPPELTSKIKQKLKNKKKQQATDDSDSE